MNNETYIKNITVSIFTSLVLSACGGGGTTDFISKSAYKLSENGDFIYEDAEDNTIDRWKRYAYNGKDYTSIQNVYDEEHQSRVISIKMSTRESAGYILGAPSGELAAWDNKESQKISWKMKVDSPYTVYVRINTTKGKKVLYYTSEDNLRFPGDDNDTRNPNYYNIVLGSDSLNDEWTTYNRDLESDLREVEKDYNNTIISVNAFSFRGSGILDDIILKNDDSI